MSGQTSFAQKAPFPEEASEAKTSEGGSAEACAQMRGASVARSCSSDAACRGRARALLLKAGPSAFLPRAKSLSRQDIRQRRYMRHDTQEPQRMEASSSLITGKAAARKDAEAGASLLAAGRPAPPSRAVSFEESAPATLKTRRLHISFSSEPVTPSLR